jgi:hypothetical protein
LAAEAPASAALVSAAFVFDRQSEGTALALRRPPMKATSLREETSLGAAGDFGIHLAQRLDISLEAALAQLGEWLVTYRPARRFPIEVLGSRSGTSF